EPVAARYTFDFMRQNLALAIGLAVAAAIVSYPFVTVVYGGDWSPAVVPFVILAAAATARAIDAPALPLLVRTAPALEISGVAFLAAAVNVALNFLLIPWLGIPGSAVASAVSYWLMALLMLRLLSR